MITENRAEIPPFFQEPEIAQERYLSMRTMLESPQLSPLEGLQAGAIMYVRAVERLAEQGQEGPDLQVSVDNVMMNTGSGYVTILPSKDRPQFDSPELRQQAQLYDAGMMLYKLAGGKKENGNITIRTWEEFQQSHIGFLYPDIAYMVKKSLHKDASERYADVNELLKDLRRSNVVATFIQRENAERPERALRQFAFKRALIKKREEVQATIQRFSQRFSQRAQRSTFKPAFA